MSDSEEENNNEVEYAGEESEGAGAEYEAAKVAARMDKAMKKTFAELDLFMSEGNRLVGEEGKETLRVLKESVTPGIQLGRAEPEDKSIGEELDADEYDTEGISAADIAEAKRIYKLAVRAKEMEDIITRRNSLKKKNGVNGRWLN